MDKCQQHISEYHKTHLLQWQAVDNTCSVYVSEETRVRELALKGILARIRMVACSKYCSYDLLAEFLPNRSLPECKLYLW